MNTYFFMLHLMKGPISAGFNVSMKKGISALLVTIVQCRQDIAPLGLYACNACLETGLGLLKNF